MNPSHEEDWTVRETIRQQVQSTFGAERNMAAESQQRCYESDGENCRHDLVRGVLAEELLGDADGDYRPVWGGVYLDRRSQPEE